MLKIYNVLLLGVLLIGVLVTQVYVVGFEHHRFFAPSWVFIALALLLCFLRAGASIKTHLWVYLSLGALSLYLALRGITAEVSIFTGKEYPVFFYGLLTFAAAFGIAKRVKPFLVMLGFLVIMHLYQITLSLIPLEVAESLPHAWGSLAKQSKQYGFFRHYNPFAAYCALNATLFTGLAFIRFAHKPLEVGVRLGAILVSFLTVMAAFASESRLGVAVVCANIVLTVAMALAFKFTIKGGRLVSKERAMTTVLAFGAGLVTVLVVFFQVFGKVSEERQTSGDLESDVLAGMRLPSMGMGVSLWMESPLVGHGPRAYWNHAPRLRSDGGAYSQRISDPEMVHNDIIQTLAEYGIVGLVLILFVLSVIYYYMWKLAWRHRFIRENWAMAPIVATVALIGVIMHSMADFPLHNASVFVQFALIMGMAIGYSASSEQVYKLESKFRINSHLTNAPRTVVALVSLCLFIAIGGMHIQHAPQLLSYDHTKWNKGEHEYIQVARETLAVAPDPIMYEELAVTLLNRISQTPNVEVQQSYLEEAEGYLEAGLALNPYRLASLNNLALVKVKLEKYEEAHEVLSTAFKYAGVRWQAYQLNRIATDYLINVGEKLWMERKASLAMTYFIAARDFITHKNQYRRGKYLEVRDYYLEKIDKYLGIMEAGKIQPAGGVEFFEGNSPINQIQNER